MEHIKGPDFPTGASIHGIDGIYDMYSTGEGNSMFVLSVMFTMMETARE